MNADERRLDHSDMDQLTEKVIGCALTVSNTLGCGFLEKANFGKAKLEVRRIANHY